MSTISSVIPPTTPTPPKPVSDQQNKAADATREANQRAIDQANQNAERNAPAARLTGTTLSPPNLVDISA